MIRALLYIGLIYAAYRFAKKGVDMLDDQEMYLARTIYGEARGEGERGMHAVANVIMNRVKKGGWYGASVKDVVLKPYQFSCWNANDPNRSIILNATEQQLAQATAIAKRAIAGNLPDITGGAINYHAKSVNPYWAASMTKTATIGNHIFYA